MAQYAKGTLGTGFDEKHLPARERLRLLGFVCSFVWADLAVSSEETEFIARACRDLELGEAGLRKVAEWMATPPLPEEVDPQTVPRKHRRQFVEAARRFVRSAPFDRHAREQMDLFEELMA